MVTITVYDRRRGVVTVGGRTSDAIATGDIKELNKWIAERKAEYPDVVVKDV